MSIHRKVSEFPKTRPYFAMGLGLPWVAIILTEVLYAFVYDNFFSTMGIPELAVLIIGIGLAIVVLIGTTVIFFRLDIRQIAQQSERSHYRFISYGPYSIYTGSAKITLVKTQYEMVDNRNKSLI